LVKSLAVAFIFQVVVAVPLTSALVVLAGMAAVEMAGFPEAMRLLSAEAAGAAVEILVLVPIPDLVLVVLSSFVTQTLMPQQQQREAQILQLQVAIKFTRSKLLAQLRFKAQHGTLCKT
jgi:hypothetical protein